MSEDALVLLGILYGSIILAVYVLPAFVAFKRQHPQRVPILLLNLLLGWTLLGWAAALIWAAVALPARQA